VEGKRNDAGMRFVLDPGVGDGGFLIWNEQVIPAIINWLDPVILHGMGHRITYVRLVRRKASSPSAQGADHDGNRYSVQLVLEGHAYVLPKHEAVGKQTIGLDIGPSTLAIVPREGKADLVTFCEELAPLSLRIRAGAARSLLGVLAGLPGTAANNTLNHPDWLGRCGAAEAHRDGGAATTCE